MELEADVPLNAINKIFHMPGRNHPDYYAIDLLSDLLGQGNSSRLFDQLVKKRKLFNSINSYITSSLDPGLIAINGKLNEGVSFEEAESALWEVIDGMKMGDAIEHELQKAKNRTETSVEFGEVELLNRAMNLALATLMGDPELVNLEKQKINEVSILDIHRVANDVLKKTNCSTLHYKSKSVA